MVQVARPMQRKTPIRRRSQPPPDGGSLYQRFRQRTPILVVAAVTITGLIIHSLPRRRAVVLGDSAGGGSDPQQGFVVAGSVEGGVADSSNVYGGTMDGGSMEERQEGRGDSVDVVDSAVRGPIAEGSVHLGMGGDLEDLPYLHCGPTYGASSKSDGVGRELILLHGAAFTKDTWRESGILDGLCLLGSSSEGKEGEEGGGLSVTALDLPVSARGAELGVAFRALQSAGVIGGEPAYFVSPSASGATIVSLGELAANVADAGFNKKAGAEKYGGMDPSMLLKRLVRGWIPVAAPYVSMARIEALKAFAEADIPLLAIYGDKDRMGKTSSQRLGDLADASTLELEGRHPCYLDSPDEFVKNVVEFINGEWGEDDDEDDEEEQQ